MPESMSIERRKMLTLLGVKLELTPKEKGMKGALASAKELIGRTTGSILSRSNFRIQTPSVLYPFEHIGNFRRFRQIDPKLTGNSPCNRVLADWIRVPIRAKEKWS
jgi:cysteine synthase